jgi:penicillin-binding protein 1C
MALPMPPRLKTPLPPSVTFLAADGSPLRQMLTPDGERVTLVTRYSELPIDLVHATLAAEDRRFFSHHGVDFSSVIRAVWDDLRAHRIVSGASTITQQLAKISADQRRARTMSAKITEAFQARRVEMAWDKERILSEYLNRVSYGNQFIGCASAALGYFRKPLADLTPAECAFLAALPQAPSRLNPFKNFRAVQQRQRWILGQMHEQGWLGEEALELANNEKITLQHYTGGFEAPHAVALLAPEASNIYHQPVVRTTIQPSLQARVEGIIQARLNALKERHVTHAAAVVLENSTGRILALVGSRDFFARDAGQINGAWSPHSPGSSVKPFTYLLAFQRGFTPATVIPDLPIEFSTATGTYRPENYDRRCHGPVTARDALGSSLNIPAVRVLKQIGGESLLLDTLRNLGISTLDQAAEHYGLGLTIGNAPVRLLELANAYACLARLGESKPWTLLQNAAPAGPTRLFPADVCYLIADILSDNQARVLSFGPHSVLKMPFRCAVKTGTSTDYRDNWTLGFTPEYTVGVWVGNFDNTPMQNVSGVSGAGPIFRDIFLQLRDMTPPTWFTEPAGMVHGTIDPRTGHRLPPDIATRMSREELFLANTLPPVATRTDYDFDTGKALLPREYGQWLKQGDAWLAGMVDLKPLAHDPTSPRVVSPADGAIIFLDPDLSEGGSHLVLRCAGDAPVRWDSHSLKIQQKNGQTIALLTTGKHELTATDETCGLQTTVRIEVRAAAEMRKLRWPKAAGS